LGEDVTAEIEASLGRITSQLLVKQAAELERARRLNVIQDIIDSKTAEFVRESVKFQAEAERERRMNDDDEAILKGDILAEINTEIRRRNSTRRSSEKFVDERLRRIFSEIAQDAAAECQRKADLAFVKAEEEHERARRIGEEVFAQATSKAMSAISKRIAIEAADTERARRMSEVRIAQAAANEENRRSAYRALVASEAERVERIDEELKSDEGCRSLLFEALIGELAPELEKRERALNKLMVNGWMDAEKGRRLQEEDGFQAVDKDARDESRKVAAQAEDEERARRVGVGAASDAAEKAASLLSKKMAIKLEDEERARRTAHFPAGISA